MDGTSAPPASERFLRPELIGAGSFSGIWRVFDRELQREVALKVLHEQDATAHLQIKREFRVLRRVPHPNVVRFHELLTDGDRIFYTMDLVEGRHLDTWFAANATAENLERQALDLVAAVRAIHLAGAIHRDIKPANLLVDGSGRLTIVDFGFATMTRSRARLGDGDASGTFAYMAPEAMYGRVVAESDWYSVGVVLHELVVGDLPPPGAAAAEVASVLEEALRMRGWPSRGILGLVTGLLSFDPPARAAAAAAFLERQDALEVSPRTSPGEAAQELVGRERELDTLRSAFTRSRSRAVAFELRGTSGIGKSGLLRAFVSGLVAEGVVVLEGQCHTTERVPYNALDGVIDDLAAHFTRRSSAGDTLEDLPVEQRQAAATLFPVLRQMPGFECGAAPVSSVQRTRVAAIAGLRAALARAADAAPVVLVLEDVEWGDAESAALLDDLLSPPPAPLLLVLSRRWPEASRGSFVERLRLEGLEKHGLELEPLSEAVVREWVEREPGPRPDGAVVDYVVAHGDGLPYLVQELLLALRQGAGTVPVGYEDLLASRLGSLDADERAFLEAAVIAGRPTNCDALADAAALSGTGKSRAEYLAARNLAKLGAGARGLEASVYHDRLRSTLLSRLPAARGRSLHLRLAEALERRGAGQGDLEPIFVHLLAAGCEEKAGTYAELAGRHAASALAFGRAVRLLREAVDLAGSDSVRLPRMMELAAALEADGRAVESAGVFERAAKLALQEGDAATRREAMLRAVNDLARGGRHRESLALLAAVLAEASLDLPSDAALALERTRPARTWLRRPQRTKASPRLSPESALERCRILWEAATGLLTSHPLVARALIADLVRVAPESHDPACVARSAVLHDATVRPPAGSPPSVRFDAGAFTNGREVDASLALAEGLRLARSARWRDALDRLGAAVEGLVRAGREFGPEVRLARLVELDALWRSGDLVGLGARRVAWIEEATMAGDEATAILARSGEPVVAWFASGDAHAARREVGIAKAGAWGEAAPLLRARVAIAETLSMLHDDRAIEARASLLGRWDELSACGALEAPGVRETLLWLRARLALSPYVATVSLLAAWRDRELRARLAEAKRCSRLLRALGEPVSIAFALQVESLAARARGRQAQAQRTAERATAAFELCHMPLYAGAFRIFAFDDASERIRAEAGLAAAGVRDVPALTRILIH